MVERKPQGHETSLLPPFPSAASSCLLSIVIVWLTHTLTHTLGHTETQTLTVKSQSSLLMANITPTKQIKLFTLTKAKRRRAGQMAWLARSARAVGQ